MYQIWTNSPEVTSTRRLNVQLSLSPDLFTYVNPEHIKIGSCDLPVRPHWATTAPPHRSHTGPALLRTDGLCQRRLDSSGQVLPGWVSPPPFHFIVPWEEGSTHTGTVVCCKTENGNMSPCGFHPFWRSSTVRPGEKLLVGRTCRPALA